MPVRPGYCPLNEHGPVVVESGVEPGRTILLQFKDCVSLPCRPANRLNVFGLDVVGRMGPKLNESFVG
jgi:hypothetical protein